MAQETAGLRRDGFSPVSSIAQETAGSPAPPASAHHHGAAGEPQHGRIQRHHRGDAGKCPMMKLAVNYLRTTLKEYE